MYAVNVINLCRCKVLFFNIQSARVVLRLLITHSGPAQYTPRSVNVNHPIFVFQLVQLISDFKGLHLRFYCVITRIIIEKYAWFICTS